MGSGLPTIGVMGFWKLFWMPMSMGESFIEFWIPSPTTNAARMTSFLPALRLVEKFKPQPVASPESSNWSASMSSHLITRSWPAARAYPQSWVGLVGGREIRHREAGLDVLQLDPVRVDALVAAGAGTLKREHQVAVLLRHRGPTELDVAVPRQAGRPPVLDGVGERVRIGKRAPGLARAELAQLTQAWRSRNVVWPESTPVPNNSNSKIVLRSPRVVGVDVLNPSRLCLTPEKVL